MSKKPFKKKEIIKKSSEFTHIIKNGTCIDSRYFTIFFEPAQKNRAGFTTSRKIKTAVLRNKIKRRLREIYRLNKGSLLKSWTIILIGKSSAITANFKQVEQEFITIAQKKRL